MEKYKFNLLLSLLLYIGTLHAQTQDGTIVLTTQAQVDAFNYSESVMMASRLSHLASHSEQIRYH